MYQVKKRDGSVVEFNIEKIETAIRKALDAKDKMYNKNILEMLALRVTAEFSNKIKDEIVTVEDIQDAVEVVLIQAGFVDVAKAYIVYRKQHEKRHNIKDTIVDYNKTIEKYLKVDYWRVKENNTAT